jgi:hypothetical protein
MFELARLINLPLSVSAIVLLGFVSIARSQVQPARPATIDPAKPPPAFLNSSLAVPKEQMVRLERAALGGDPEAALKLAMHFEFVRMDHAKSESWMTIAAENGSPIGEYSLGVDFGQKGGAQNRLRALYWLKKAKAAGETGCKMSGCVSALQRVELGLRP